MPTLTTSTGSISLPLGLAMLESHSGEYYVAQKVKPWSDQGHQTIKLQMFAEHKAYIYLIQWRRRHRRRDQATLAIIAWLASLLNTVLLQCLI